LLDGVLDLYEAALKPDYLEFATVLAESMTRRFQDSEHGGFFQNEKGASDRLIMDLKPDYDGAEPSGNSVAALALLRLGAMLDRRDFTAAAMGTLRWLGSRLDQAPQSVPHLLHALDFASREPVRIALSGDMESPEWIALLHAAHGVYQPDKVVVRAEIAGMSGAEAWEPARAHVCTGSRCHAPVTDPVDVTRLVRGQSG
jgi:uncharacterized protein YyaL (SSP411 family)